MNLQFSRLLTVAALAVSLAACGTMTPAMPSPVTEPVIDQPGSTIYRYRDSVIEVMVDTRFAAANLGEPWLILNLALSGMTGGASQVKRELVSVRTPDGRVIPLPSYSEFLAAYDKELTSAARRAELAGQPLDFTRANRRDCALDFMPLPGSGESARTALNVTNREVCTGALYFPVAGGVQPGDWRLVLEFEETDAVVPFTLGEP
jgi:predicted small lipoprotein YifL